MIIRKCDLCGNVIENNKMVSAGLGLNLWAKSLCIECGKPVILFLLENKLADASQVSEEKV